LPHCILYRLTQTAQKDVLYLAGTGLFSTPYGQISQVLLKHSIPFQAADTSN